MFDIQLHPQSTIHTISFLSLQWAQELFDQARQKAGREKVITKLLQRPSMLLEFSEIPVENIQNQHYGGLHPIPIHCIRGTLGRSADFDHHFAPLSDRLRDRWMRVLVARCQNIPLPPVELIRVGEQYFVKDGHHRISVAQALGETMVDAEITIWQLVPLRVAAPLPN